MSIVEVAKAAGTSHATVSRVINKRGGVSPKTTAAVLEAMDRLGYQPAPVRRGPKPRPTSSNQKESATVGLLWFGTDAAFARAPVATLVLHGVERAIGEAGSNLLVSQIDRNAPKLPSWIDSGQVNGLLLHGQPPPEPIASLLSRLPSVWLLSARESTGYWGDRVAPDNHAIGAIAARYLLDQGHRRLAYLFLDPTHCGFEQRREAFVGIAEQRDAQVTIVSPRDVSGKIHSEPRFTAARIDEALTTLFDSPERPTGLFVPSDRLVAVVYGRLRAMGLEPQRDVQIISCDNEWSLDALVPRPATIDLRPELIGRTAVDQLMLRLKEPNPHVRSTLTVQPYLVPPDGDTAAEPESSGSESVEGSPPVGG